MYILSLITPSVRHFMASTFSCTRSYSLHETFATQSIVLLFDIILSSCYFESKITIFILNYVNQ